MSQNKEDEILRVAMYGGLNESSRLLWIKLWLLFGDREFQITRPELAKIVDENVNTFFIRYKNLKKIKAMKTTRKFTNRRGAEGVIVQIMPPSSWISEV